MRFLQSLSLGMSRRPGNPSRRYGDGGGGALFAHSKPRSPSFLSTVLIVLCTLLLVAYLLGGSGFGRITDISRVEGDFSCTLEAEQAIPVLKKAYGDIMHKVLHVGPDTCSVASKLLKDETEAWGVEPYDIEDADTKCKGLVRRGIVRVADIKFPLPYRPKSFPLVIVSDALDYLSLRYLNKTLPDLARVSTDGLVIFTGSPGQQRAKAAEVTKFGKAAKLRSSTWWVRYFGQANLEVNGAAAKKFEQASTQLSYSPSCQVFHLKPFQ